MEICMELDYIRGYVRDGHLEGKVHFSEEEEKDFRTLLQKDLNEEELTDEEIDRLDGYKDEILDNCDVVIDWYDIEDRGDFHWEYLDPELKEKEIQRREEKEENKYQQKSVLCVETNIIYNSIREASRKTGISRGALNSALLKDTSTAFGYHWRFIDAD